MKKNHRNFLTIHYMAGIAIAGGNILREMVTGLKKLYRPDFENLPELAMKQLFCNLGYIASRTETLRIGFIGFGSRDTDHVSNFTQIMHSIDVEAGSVNCSETMGGSTENLMSISKRVRIIMVCSFALLLGGGIGCAAQNQGTRSPGTHQDNTEGKEWIRRLERPDRIPGLKIDEVVRCLQLRPGDVVADIGAGTGAYTIPFSKAVAPTGWVFGVDIHQDLLDYIDSKASRENVRNLQTILAKLDDPNLPKDQVDVAFFNDVFHNMNDREAYLKVLASYLKPNGRIAIIEQEYDDPIAKKWDLPEDRITREQVQTWMAHVGFYLIAEFEIFQGANNPIGAGMPERWFVVYSREEVITR